jgi:hypothetical protein
MLRDRGKGAMYAIVTVLAGLLVLAGAAWWYCFGMPGRSHRGALPPLTAQETALAQRLRQHVEAIASRPHNIAHYAELEAAAAYIEGALAGIGYGVVAQVFEADGRSVRNIEATVEPAGGTAAAAKSLVIGAHYDSAGSAPGANDNGTGTAAVIELARLLKDASLGHRLRLVLFVNEEPPYFHTAEMGSLRYADALAARGEPVAGMLSLETLGSFSDAPGSQSYPWPLSAFFPDTANFIAFVGMPASRGLVARAIGSFRSHTAFPSVGGVAPAAIPGIDWSDHWSFARLGIPALMVTDTAIFRYAHYHRQTDTPDKVDYERLARITKGLERTVRELAR